MSSFSILAKPFAVAELRARVRSLGRRRTSAASAFSFSSGTVRLDFAARRAYRSGRNVELTAREWIVLELLAERPGRLAQRSELLERGWGDAASQTAAASLEVLVGRIRRKLGTTLIRTVRGEGYALELLSSECSR